MDISHSYIPWIDYRLSSLIINIMILNHGDIRSGNQTWQWTTHPFIFYCPLKSYRRATIIESW